RNGGTSATIQLSASIEHDGCETALPFHFADADYKDERYSNGWAILGVTDMWRTSSQHPKEPQTAVYVLEKPIQVASGDKLVLTFQQNGAGCVRLSISP